MKKFFLVFCFSLCIGFLFFAKEDFENSVYKIQNIFFEHGNNFHELSLIKKIPIDTKSLFTKDDLEKYLEELEKDFLDTRLIDFVKIDYEIISNTSVNLFVKIQKSGNFIIFPYPKYDSNSGLSLKIKIKDYNAFKRMEVFSSDFTYNYTQDKTNAIEGKTDFIFPFNIGYTNNKIYSDIDLFYNIDKSIFQSNSKLGIEFAFPISRFSLNVFFEEIYLVENDSKLNQALGLFFPIHFGKNIDFILKPGFMFLYSFLLESPYTSTFFLIPSFDIETKKISYLGNFRKGYELNVETNIDYSLSTQSFNPNVLFQGSFFYPELIKKNEKLFLPSSRILYYFNGEKTFPMGFFNRGILDHELEAKHALVLNNDFTFKLFNTKFNKKHSSKFNFELQTGIFFDTSFVFDPEFIFDQSMGVQVIVQPEAMKSVQGRISVAGNFDWTNPKKQRSSGLEIYIGIGLFY